MIFNTIIFGTLICLPGANSIQFQKINADSIEEIWPSKEGYTSRSTNAIIVGMKNGDSITVLYDKNGHLSPGSLTISKSKKWFTIANPNWKYRKGSCGSLLCSLCEGICKCAEVVADSGYNFWDISDSIQGGCKLYAAKAPKNKHKKNRQKIPEIILSEDEMTKRFLGDYNKAPHIE